jgi:aldehyde:ferredoxin oxidoreductase
VELRDASHLRGKSALQTSALIQEELNDSKLQVAAIGLAGENGVYQATIDHANTSASRGVGVVMGDKGLKAIAVRGTRDINVAQPVELFEICNSHYQEIYDNPSCGDVLLRENDDSWHAQNLGWSNTAGRAKGYWSKEVEDEWSVQVESEHVHFQWENYSQQMEEVHEKVVDASKRLRGTGCFNCTKNCHEAVYLPGERKYFMKSYAKLAYAMAAYDLKLNYDILFAMQEYGLDEFAMPQLLAFVVDLHQAGILTDKELPEFPADSAQRLSYLVEIVARREGLGDLLAKGVYQAAREIGKGAEAYDRSAKKIEQAPLKPETAAYPHFLMHATGGKMSITQIEGSFPQAPIAAKKARKELVKHWDAAPENFKKLFLEWEPKQELSAEAAVAIADWNEAMHSVDDAVGICPLLSSFRGQFGAKPPYHLHNLPQFISLAAGLQIDAEGLLEISRRNRQLVRAINARRGLRRADEKAPQGPWKNEEPELQQLLDAYYEFRGWNGDGVPSKETLDGLGLGYVREDLVKRGILAER